MTTSKNSSITLDVSIRSRWLLVAFCLVGLKRFALRWLVKVERKL